MVVEHDGASLAVAQVRGADRRYAARALLTLDVENKLSSI